MAAGRSTATVLFTDLVASTELRSRLGEEAAEALRREHDGLVTAAIGAHRGRVVKHLGDGVMATFAGTSDGVAAAVAIQQAIDRRNRSGAGVVPLEVRIGVSAGDVTFELDDCFGTPVIEAARLCAAVEGGRILVTEVVRLLAGKTGDHDFGSRQELELKGLLQPVAACEVAWEPLPGPSLPLPALLTLVGRIFVGRDDELDRLHRLWKEAEAGERRLVLLAGEPGVGKTRLAAELAGALHDAGAVVLAGRCDEDLGVPYQPFVEAFRHFVDHAQDDLTVRLGRYGGELVRLVPELAERVPGLPPPIRSDPETERYRLFDAVAAWLGAVSAQAPVLLILDDLQWAAKPTLLLLRHVLRAAGPARLLVLVTYRDTDVGRGHPLAELLADLRRSGGSERLPLTGLDAGGVATIIEQASGQALEEWSEDLARALWAETEGNPFFVVEVLRHLVESGALERRHGRWLATALLGEGGIPEGVRDVVGRRLSRLSEAANRTLTLAAVAGAEFDAAVVATAGGLEEDTVVAALDEAVTARLLTDVPGPVPRSRFSHALVRATLYDELSTGRRAVLHRKVAEAFESVHRERLDDHLPALAHHWARASAPPPGKAVDYAARAGNRALAQLAHDEAVAYYRQALELLEAAGSSPAGRRRLDLLIDLGEAQRRAGDPAHRQTLLDAAALAETSGDIDALGRAALANNRGFFSSVFSIDRERVAVLEAALDGLGPADSPLRARLLATLAAELTFSRQRGRRHQLAAEARAMARRLGDEATLGLVLATSFAATAIGSGDVGDPLRAAVRPGEVNDALERSAELAAIAERLADPALTFWAAFNTHISAFIAARFDLADAALEDVARSAEALGQRFMAYMVAFLRGNWARTAGRLAEAEELAESALTVGLEAGVSESEAFRVSRSMLFMIRYEQGRTDEVVEMLTRAAAKETVSPLTFASLALALVELGDLEQARAAVARVAADDFASMATDHSLTYGLTMLAQACARIGDIGWTEALHRQLVPFRGTIATTWSQSMGAVDHFVGLLDTVAGRYDQAEECFGVAAAVHERVGAPAWIARTRLEWASMLLTRGRAEDVGTAREYLDQALATARQYGLGGIERRAVALLGQLSPS